MTDSDTPATGEANRAYRPGETPDASDLVGSEQYQEKVFSRLLDRVVRRLGAERAFAGFVKEGDELRLRMTYNISEEPSGREASVSRTIVDDVAERGEPVLIENALSHPELREQTSVRTQGIRSVICVPITLRDEVLGVVYVDNMSTGGQFDEDDLEMLTLLSSYAGAALYAARFADGGSTYDSARLAHDFKNVLSAIQTRLALLEMGEDTEQDIDRNISAAKQAVETGRRLVREASPGYSSDSSVINLRELLEECADLQTGPEDDAAHTVHIRGPKTPTVAGNRVALEELFNNLLSNAVDAMPGGGRITVHIRRDGGSWNVTVQDEGPGLPEENPEKIFEPFFSTDSEEGTGLGLNITRNIARRHGGEVRVHHGEGDGAAFVVELPVAAEDQG